MVDTGATHSFITQRALSTLYHSAVPSCDRIAQLGDGHTLLKILGEVQLLLQFDRVFTPLNVLVVKTMNTDFILGSDWCTENATRIDYHTNQVSICSKNGRIFIPFDRCIDYLTLDVKSINVIHIPPRESYTVQAKVELSSADTVYFSPIDVIQSENSIIMSPALLHINNYTTYLEVYNPHDYTYTLPTNTLLGRVTHTPYHVPSFLLFDPSSRPSSVSSQPHILNAIELEQTSPETSQTIDHLIAHITNVQDKQQLRSILHKHMKLFDTSKVTQANTPIQHTINTGDSLPVSSRPYPRTIEQRRELQDEIQKMIQTNQIRPSNSPWSSPVIIHKKKDGGIRFLVDYRKLNSVTKKDCFPQPTTEELLHRLGGHRFYTKLDLKSGYFQLPIHEKDKEKTAFITQDGLWEFNVLPQGIMNGPPTFQRTMHNLLGYGRWDYVMVYLDDILIFSRSFDEHKKHLNEILSILAKANFQVNPDKCSIAVQEIDFLSHTVNEQCIKPNGDKIKAIIDLPAPKTLTEANEFLGKINWYRKFIPDFARIAAPLHKVTNKTKHHRHEFTWGPDQQQSVDEFKRILTTFPLFLEYPDLSTPFVLTTDASDIGIGGILRQDTPNGTKINYFKSRVLNDTERKYDTFEKEALAIFWCISELRPYIGDSNFIVETDHKPLENFHNKQINNKRVMNWLFKLQDILPQIIAVKYRAGANNSAADYISRHFPPSASITINPATINVTHDDWPIGDQHWSEEVPKPQRTQFIQPSISKNTCIRNAGINAEINAVTTRAQSKLQAQLRSPSVHTSSTSQSTCSSPSTANQLYDFSLSRIRSEQAHDVTIQQIIQQIRNNRHYESFIIQQGILYKLARRDDTTIKLVYAPSKLIPELMAAYHDHPLSGHFGTGRTWSTLRNTYYWPRMKDTITSYIKSCDKCSQFNVDRHKPPGFLQSIQPPNDVFQILGMDWWGPTTISLSGNRYVLVITDRLSGYVFAKASPTNTAQDSARILMEEIILVHGSPDVIITDQGTHFQNELMQAISHLVGCKHIFSTPYHPQTNGQTERWNSTFVTQIAKYCNTDQNNWDTFLPSIVYAYNNGIHSSTGFSPYQLAFGRRPRHPFNPPASTFVFNKPHDYWMQVIQYRNAALKQAKENIIHQQELSKIRFDKNRSHPNFVPGDLVWMKIFVGRHKLKARYTGPARIIRIFSPVSFIVEDDKFQRFQVHSNNIRRVYSREQVLP
ncbi:unnamed protein product [Rotaria sordida]|uniref:RNA-directed DNA polymerase n=1 Tax=Rotaria sordida TaxID=392033 RepID=A0A819SIY4_9BILA|nr:unnamed protein product [Rotaria sordida]CAF1387023.1 unnamed protein product [Rotaria sordida]CAF4006711.1 unnamed protein product [Rotaria sordida]CAF4041357.1 unnamed protein product [Rotaria sordida]CAF4071411.1 unnamed protein product [Rotaria sordida]